MTVDIEKIVGDYLRAHADIAALATRVVSKTPTIKTGSWVKLVMLDAAAPATSRAEHLHTYLLQIDCYASAAGIEGVQAREANLIVRTVRAALHDMRGTRTDAVITQVRFIGMPRIPDTDFEPARERYILTATVTAHAA